MSTDAVGSFIDAKRATITREQLESLYQTIREMYLNDRRPWVIGYSGGKDSTATLQVVWYALSKLPVSQLDKPVYVISSDTLVETPVIVDHLNGTMAKIESAARAQGLPFTAHTVRPELDDTFWVNLIGRGYPAPYTNFRWCTDRMKILPATKFIMGQVAKFGEVVLVLGARKSESASRAQVMNARRKVGELLSRHCDIVGAWVFTPLEDWRTEDVWLYLLNAPSPWGSQNRDLVTMYRNAQAGECPLVVDSSTPSCGNSRFGCWTCTVVTKDKSMEAMIDAGQDWMEPMLEFRNWLASTQDPAKKHEIRETQRRTGRVQLKILESGETKVIWGPYKLPFRKVILRRLLEAQLKVRQMRPDADDVLIRHDELQRIRQIWQAEGDWEDSLPGIFKEATGQEFDWSRDDWSGMGGAEKSVLEEVAAKRSLHPRMLMELFEAERELHGMNRRTGIFDKLDTILRKDWRALDEVMAEAKRMREGFRAEEDTAC